MNILSKSAADKNPFNQFSLWYEEIIHSGITEPTAVILATAGKRGIPSVRTVLLKGYDDKGFVFYTNYKSRKGKEISENPYVEMLFLWKEFERQVRIAGKAEKVLKEESEDYFKLRPYESRIGAWASEQSSRIENRDILERRYNEFKNKFKEDVPRPDHWGGYRVIPGFFEFWQGRQGRLHDRICYEKKGSEWEIFRLAP